MPRALALIFVGSLTLHVVLANVIPSFWWLPDLTLVGLILTVAKAPRWWFPLSGLAAIFMAVWAVRFPAQVLLSYLTVGWLVQRLSKQWDAMDLRVQSLMVTLASLAVTLGLLWLEDLWSLAILGLVTARVAMTGLAVVIIRRLAVHWL